MDVIKPLIMASGITIHTLTSGANSWKAKIVPKSPMEQPSKHHNVFLEAVFHVGLQVQEIDSLISNIPMGGILYTHKIKLLNLPIKIFMIQSSKIIYKI